MKNLIQKLLVLFLLVFGLVTGSLHASPQNMLITPQIQIPNNFLATKYVGNPSEQNLQEIIDPIYLGLSIAVASVAGSFNNKFAKEYLYSKKYFCSNKTPYAHTHMMPRLCIH